MRKKESTWKLILRIIVLIAVIALCVGLVIVLVKGITGSLGGDDSGGHVNKPQATGTGTGTEPDETSNTSSGVCEHTYQNGVCTKCGTICTHKTTENQNGNTYCSVCGMLTALKAPTISVDGNTVSWSSVPDAETYRLYINGDFVQTLSQTSYVFSADEAGDFTVTVRAQSGSVQSLSSNGYTFHVYSIAVDLTGLQKVGGVGVFSDVVISGNNYAINIEPNISDYSLPDDLSIFVGAVKLEKGTGYTFEVLHDETARLTILASAITGNITITGSGVLNGSSSYTVSNTIENGWLFSSVGTDDPATSIEAGETYMARIDAAASHSRPETITVTMGGSLLVAGTSYTYDSETGQISIPNVSGDIVITATCSWAALPAPTGLVYDDNTGTFMWNPVEGADSYSIRIMDQESGFTYDERFSSTQAVFDLLETEISEAGNYYFSVWANDENGQGDSVGIEFTVQQLSNPLITSSAGLTSSNCVFIVTFPEHAAGLYVYVEDDLLSASDGDFTTKALGHGEYEITISPNVFLMTSNVYVVSYSSVGSYVDSEKTIVGTVQYSPSGSGGGLN